MKPLWRDGLFMMPQHFQLQDRHQDLLLEHRLATLQPNGWGVAELEIDEEALQRGAFQVRRLSALMPDGLWVEVGSEAPVREITVMVDGALPRGGKRAELYLGVPTDAGRGSTTYLGEEGTRGARWVRGSRLLPDDYGVAEESDIEWVRPNAQLLLGVDDRSSYVTLKLAELEVGEGGALMVSEAYVPPCTAFSVSRALVSRFGRIVAAAGAKQAALASRYRGRSTSLVEFGAADMITFWYLHTLNSALPGLLHVAQQGRAHPERLYLTMAELAGQLATFEPQRKPKDVPPYDHRALADTLFPVFDQVETLLKTVIAQSYKSIPLEQVQRGLFVAQKIDPTLLKKSQLYLVASGDVPEQALRRELPHYVRIASYEQISQVVQAAVPGLEVKVDLAPPPAIPVKAENVYLRLGQEGTHWKDILRTGTVAIFQPVQPQVVTLELLAVEV